MRPSAVARVTGCMRSSSWRRLRQVSEVVVSATRMSPCGTVADEDAVGPEGVHLLVYFHPNLSGQQMLAKITYDAGFGW